MDLLIVPIRKELHEAQEDIGRLIKKEITEIPHLSQQLAYATSGLLELQNAEVFCMGICTQGAFYTLHLIDGRLA